MGLDFLKCNETERTFSSMRWAWLAGTVLALSLAGCAGAGIPDARSTTGRNPTLAEVPDANETVRGEDDPPIVTLELGAALHERRLNSTDDLPGNIIIPTTNLNAVPITAALQAVLSGTDISLSWDTGSLGNRLVTVMNLSGPLPQVVAKICDSAKVFCGYRNGSLELNDKETFVVALPPLAGKSSSSTNSTSNSMADTISDLAGGKVKIDDQGGNIIYTTDVDGENRVRAYLEQLRNGRPLIVMQLYIWEVTLDKQNSEGINWSAFKIGQIPLGGSTDKLALASSSAFTAITGGVSLGAITTGHVNANAVAQFLATQGRVQTISNPQITFVSGSSAEFKVGGKQNYISSVGQLVTASNVSGTSNSSTASGVGTNTVSTDSVNTGLTVDISGSYENGVVFANLDLALTNLVKLDAISTAGTQIQLPTTSDRKVSTVLRVRPGDNLVMAGLVTSQDTNNREGIPFGNIGKVPTYGNDKLENTELVIVVKPSVVLFSDKMMREEAKAKEKATPLPDAVMIDKDGAKDLAVPQASAKPASFEPKAASRPELMLSEPNATPLQSMPASPDTDKAPVDQRLMQRGFSHAFNELLQPVPSGNEGKP